MSTYADLLRYLEQFRQMHGTTAFVDRTAQPFEIAETETSSIAIIANETESIQPMADSTPLKQWAESASLAELYTNIHTCTNCPLGHTRTSFVFGSGNPDANLMIVGEAPGADEDLQGLPFVGRAGQLLTKILEAIQFQRDDVYICNILKCRPPNNRKPLADETDECEPYLIKQIELVRPKVILALGLTAANTLLKNKDGMAAMRSTVHAYRDIPLVVTYHPAALLRNPEWKRQAWEDVQQLRVLYDDLVNTSTL